MLIKKINAKLFNSHLKKNTTNILLCISLIINNKKNYNDFFYVFFMKFCQLFVK